MKQIKDTEQKVQKNIQKIKARLIIFDLDQTLVNSTACICNSMNAALQSVGASELSHEKIRLHIGLPIKRFLEVLLKHAHPRFKDLKEAELKEKITKGIQAYKEYFKKTCTQTCTLYPHAKETIEELEKRGKKLAIATTAKLELAVSLLKYLGILDYFEAIIGEEDLHQVKPDPESIYLITEKLGIPPEQTIMVGDTVMDMEAGKSAGTHIIAVDYGVDTAEELKAVNPDGMIHDLKELLDYID